MGLRRGRGTVGERVRDKFIKAQEGWSKRKRDIHRRRQIV